jgi:transposase
MDKLDDISAGTLRDRLGEVENAKAAQRLMVALAYKDGVTVATMSERYGIPASTLYYWLDRFENRSLDDAIEDEKRPGRPSKLDADERERFETALRESPRALGYDNEEWTAALAQHHLEREFGVSYSIGHLHHYFGDLL